MIADKVIDYVANTTGITRVLMRSRFRQREIIDAKQIVAFSLQQLGFTQKFIADKLNYSDHTTVNHLLNKRSENTYENKILARKVVKACNDMAYPEIRREKLNMEEFLEMVQQIN